MLSPAVTAENRMPRWVRRRSNESLLSNRKILESRINTTGKKIEFGEEEKKSHIKL